MPVSPLEDERPQDREAQGGELEEKDLELDVEEQASEEGKGVPEAVIDISLLGADQGNIECTSPPASSSDHSLWGKLVRVQVEVERAFSGGRFVNSFLD